MYISYHTALCIISEDKIKTFEGKPRRNYTKFRIINLPMYLRDFGDEPSCGNLQLSTYLDNKIPRIHLQIN
jgi:hypothetical protein